MGCILKDEDTKFRMRNYTIRWEEVTKRSNLVSDQVDLFNDMASLELLIPVDENMNIQDDKLNLPMTASDAKNIINNT